MNNVTIFENKEFGQVRTLNENNTIYFCGMDVAKALGYKDTTKAIQRHCRYGVAKRPLTDSLGRKQETNFIGEPDLYRLIINSNLPSAQAFEKWVMEEVLPSIRQHGGYVQGQEEMSPEELMARALQYANSKMKELQGRLEEKEVETSRLIVENNKMIPKAEYFDALVDRNLLTSFRDTAKQLGVREKLFVQFLLDKKYIYRNKHGKLKPYAEKGEGLFEIKEFLNSKNDFAATQTLITPKGREVFRLLTQGL